MPGPRDNPNDATRWVGGRIVDGEPRPAGSAWAWLASVALIVLAVDLVLAFGAPAQGGAASDAAHEQGSTATLRARLSAASEVARSGAPSFVLVGDSVLAGDVMTATVPDWASQRVVDHMRAELSLASAARFEQIAFDGLLPIDALHVLAELDRLDPAGEVSFVLELNLRYFSTHYAELDDCTRPQLCALGRGQLGRDLPKLDEPPGTLARAAAGLREGAGLVRDWLQARAPVHRHRPSLRAPDLAGVDGLAVAQAEPEPQLDAEGVARVGAHYRDSLIDSDHAQLDALAQIAERLRARGRPAALFFTPLEDEFARATLPGDRLGQRESAITSLIHDRGLSPGPRPNIAVLDLDHPLFGADSFLDHVHLGPEGNRMLALNLLHELGLPLRERPRESMLVHGEDHDRSLIHRRGRGFADGGATRALFRKPEGVAVSRSGDWIVIADTGNHVLRQLRGSMQFVERLAGQQKRPGGVDGPAFAAKLHSPRSPEIVGDAVYLIDGEARERLRELADATLTTLRWAGPSCDRYAELEARDGRLYLLCDDDRVLALDPRAGRAEQLFEPRAAGLRGVGLRGLEPTDDGRLLLVDDRSRIWSLDLRDGAAPAELVFANRGAELLPNKFKWVYPFSFAEMRMHRIVALEWIDRHDLLLVQDEHDLAEPTDRLERELSERVHLRVIDLDAELIYPWLKPIPHAEAFHMWNEVTQSLVSYFHLGAMALVQDDASLVWVERERSRVFRIADGLLAGAKSGNLQTTWPGLPQLQPFNSSSAAQLSATLRPDRGLDRRWEPIPRKGPYVALLLGSSLSAISDRFANYSLARLLELELQAELGYRDGVRLDLYQRTFPAASLRGLVNQFGEFMNGEGPPPDIVLIELHDFERKYLRGLDDRAAQRAQLARIERLAARYDSLVIFYDNSALIADGRDGLRATSEPVKRLIADARKLGFVVLEPSDRLLRELLVESPWGNQSWGPGIHHGAPWAVELTAEALASMAAPVIREFLRDRTPARLRERDPASFEDRRGRVALAEAFVATAGLVEFDALPHAPRSFITREYDDRRLELLVDLAGVEELELERDAAGFEALALAVLHAELEGGAYGQLAERVDLQIVEFTNYDEYGEGVREAAVVVWQADYDRAQLEALIRRVAGRSK